MNQSENKWATFKKDGFFKTTALKWHISNICEPLLFRAIRSGSVRRWRISPMAYAYGQKVYAKNLCQLVINGHFMIICIKFDSIKRILLSMWCDLS